MCLLTGLTIKAYSALLIECKLVRINELRDGSQLVQVDKIEWDKFLMGPDLRGDIVGRGRRAELTDGCINKAAIKITAEIEGEEGNMGSTMMWMLRVGKLGSVRILQKTQQLIML
jgi:hypothetical protein